MKPIPIQKPAIAPQVIRAERCEKCKWAHISGQVMECHYNPPQVIVLPVSGGVTVRSFFPPVEQNQFCANFHVKVEGVS